MFREGEPPVRMSELHAMILVVDDEEGIRENVRELLEDAGYRVAVACDGHEALRLLKQDRPAVVILDLILPLLSGNEIYDIMQRTPDLAKVPVVVTTSDPTRSPPGLPILGKPIQLDHLLRMISLCTDGLDHEQMSRSRR
jgi:PleD family two-component response regulator